MKEVKVLLIASVILMNIIFILPNLFSTPVEALDYGMDQDLGDVDASFWGESSSDYSGRSVAGAGDVNGDGYDDILIGAFFNNDGAYRAGQTYLILGKATGLEMNTDLSDSNASFWGEDEDDRSGRSVAVAGDVNGDGYDDILIGAYLDDDGGSNAGQTYLILGKASGWTMDTDLSNSDASFRGENAHDNSGWSVAGAGDVNGDGYDDILIGAYMNNDGGADSGQTYLILGKATGWAMDTDLSNSDASFRGEDTEDNSGEAVAGAGDVNGDGYDDILIGAKGDSEGGTESGQTYLILGKTSGWAMDTDLSASDASFRGEDENDNSGCSVAGAGDVNGDGYDDILIGAQLDDDGGSNAGQTYLILGKDSGWAMDADLSISDASFWGESSYHLSGESVAGAGDVNGDGYDDILIGASGCSDGGHAAGQTYLILGKASGWAMDTDLSVSDASFWGEDREDDSGVSVAGAEDVNGDGYDDILIGARWNDDGGSNAGQTYLIFPDHNSGPTSIISVKAYSDNEYSHEIISGEPGDKVYMELAASDEDASRKNIAEVWVKGSSNPAKQFRLRLHETGANTGKFRGEITLASRTHSGYHWIDASLGDWVQITSRKDQTKFVKLTICDKIDINPKPTLVYASEDSPFFLHFSAGGIIPDTWHFDTNANSWLNWEDGTQNITGTPDNSHVGSYWVEVKAETTDACGMVNFTIRVNNTAPVITTPNVIKSYEEMDYIVDYDSTDDGEGTITWHLSTNALWLHMDPITGILSGRPQEDDIGSYIVNITVEDGNGGSDHTDFNLEVLEKNHPPALTDLKISPPELFRGETATIYIEASDPESGTEMEIPVLQARSLTSDWNTLECSYNFGGNNYTAKYATDRKTETRTHSFRVKLTDLGNSSSGWYYSNDTLTVKNNPPVIRSDLDKISVYNDEDTIVDLVSHSSDYENSPSEIHWSVVEYSPLTLFDVYMKNSTAVEIWPASYDKAGLGTIKFKITDKDRGEGFKNVTVEILNASDRPKISIILQSPQNGAILGSTSLNLTWSVDDDAGIIDYNVYLGDSAEKMSMIYKKLDVKEAGISELTDGQTYYWKITAEVSGIPTIFESEIRHFTVQLGFIPVHNIEIHFNSANVSVKRGDSALITLTFKNLGNVAETVKINVLGELKEYVNMDDTIELVIGEQSSININIFAVSKLEAKTYDLSIEAVFSGERTTASMYVEITGELKTEGDSKNVMSWFCFVIGAILILVFAGLLIFVILQKGKSTDDEEEEEEEEVIEAEIEARAPTGITQADLELLSIGKSGQAEEEPFRGRLAETSSSDRSETRLGASLKYKLPSHKTHHRRSPISRVTVPDGDAMDAGEMEPKILPQTTRTLPVVAAKPIPTAPFPQDQDLENEVARVSGSPIKNTVPETPVLIKPLPPLIGKSEETPPFSEHLPSWDLLQEESTHLKTDTGKKPSFMDVEHTMLFKVEDSMPCSICHGNITEGLQAIRCNCGNISHISCGIKAGKCHECGTGYEDIIDRASEEAIIESLEDSRKTAKIEGEGKDEGDEKDDLIKGLFKKFLNKEITMEEYKMLSEDIKESFLSRK